MGSINMIENERQKVLEKEEFYERDVTKVFCVHFATSAAPISQQVD